MSTIMPVRHGGNESLFLAVEMSVISTLAGIPLHIHAEGLRGTGKTTVMRWAKNHLPDIPRTKGCPFHCAPGSDSCPFHRKKKEDPHDTDGEYVQMPFVEIGHGAKLGTILGSIDLKKLTSGNNPEATLLPGAIPMANRGIIFIDEVNRLAETAPEITDVLLSVMGTKPGQVKIEETGLAPYEINICSSVWAASNPDEDPGPLSDIRKQLADRFDLVVPVQRPTDPQVIENLLLKNKKKDRAGTPMLEEIQAKVSKFSRIVVPPNILRYMANLYVQRNVESLRAIESLELTTRIAAAVLGRDEVGYQELSLVLPLVLRHRVEPLVLAEILKELELKKAAGAGVKPNDSDSNPYQEQKKQGMHENQNKERQHSPSPRVESKDLLNVGSQGTTNSWFSRLFSKLKNSCTQTHVKSWTNPNLKQAGSIPNPKSLPPVSPPDPARALRDMRWAEAVQPPEWRWINR